MKKIIISIILISCLFLIVNVAHAGPKKFFNGGSSIICSLIKIPHFLLVRASRKDSMGIISGTLIAAFWTADGVIRGGVDMLIPVGKQLSNDSWFTRLLAKRTGNKKVFSKK